MIWFYPDNIESGGKCGLHNIKIRNSPPEWHEFFLCFRIFDRPGPNFNAIKIFNFAFNFTDGRPYRRLQSVQISD